MIVTNTPLAMFLRKGTTAEPYVFITEENRRISDGGTIVLQEFPINQTGYVATNNVVSDTPDPVAVEVTLNLDDGAGSIVPTVFSEITDPEAPLGEGQFRVDYEFGLIHFNPLLYGSNEDDTTRNFVTKVTYAGRGSYYIAASRIYDDATYTNDLSQGELFQTLQDVLDNVNSITVNSTTTGAPGTDASVTVDGTAFDFVIPRGEPFTIAAKYASVADLSSETPTVDPSDYEPSLFDLVMVDTGSVEDDENARLYIYDGVGQYGGFTFVSDMSGATGPARDIQWKSETTSLDADAFIIRWANADNTAWDASTEKNLALTPSWSGTELTIRREEDDYTATLDLGITPSWSGTTLTLSPNDGSTDATYDLGITASFTGSVLTLSPNDGSADATYDVGITPSWSGSELIISPNNGDPDITYDVGITPSWNDGTLTITPNDGSTAVSYDLGWDAEFAGTILTFTPDNGDAAISSDLGITPSWSGTTLSLTPNIAGSTPVDKDLGTTPSWSASTLTITPNDSPGDAVSADLGLTFSFDADQLTIESNLLDGSSNPLYSESVSLGLDYTWGGTGLTDTTLTIQDKVGGSAISQELGTYAEWGDGTGETVTSVRFQNGDGTYTDYQELGLDASFTGTTLTITKPDTTTISQDLQAETPTITAEATSIAYTGSASVTVTEPTPNTFNLAFDIPIGEPLSIDVSYASVADMANNTSPDPSGYTPSLFDVAIIQSPEGAENADNAKLYIYQEVSGTPTWVFMSDLSGVKGETGDTGDTGPMPDHQWVGTSLQFEVPEGGYGDLVDLKGDKGDSADDADINNTSTLGDLNGLANQKVINEYFEAQKVNVDSLGSNILVYPILTDSAIEPAYYQLTEDISAIGTATDVYTTDNLQAGGTSLITGSGSLVGAFICDTNLFVGNPGVIGITTIGNIKKVSTDTADAEFYFTVSKYDTLTDTEAVLTTSGTTPTVSSLGYEQFFETALLNNGDFLSTDLIIIKYYANKIGALNDPIYAFQFGGTNPVRTLLPVPVSVLPLETKVDKAGDTITGELIIDQADFKVEGSASTVFLVDVSAEKAYVGANEVATLQSFVAGVEETNTNANISFWVGTQAEYDLIATPDANTLYFITDN